MYFKSIIRTYNDYRVEHLNGWKSDLLSAKQIRTRSMGNMFKQNYKRATVPLLIGSLFIMYWTVLMHLTLLYKKEGMELGPLPKTTAYVQRSSGTRMFTNPKGYIDMFQTRTSNHSLSATTLQEGSPLNETKFKSKPPYIKAPNIDAFIYSAVFVKYTKIILHGKQYFRYSKDKDLQNASDYVSLNGWEDKLIKSVNFTCCIRTTNGSIISFMSSIKRNWGYLGMAKYQAKQYVCPLHFQTYLVDLVTVTAHNTSCDPGEQYYVRPVRPVVPSKSTDKQIAVCAKLAYGSLDPAKLLEWLEAHRYFGVSKILLYTFKLNAKAMEILYAYEKYGFVELKEFGLPMASTLRRNVGEENMQSWNDEQVVVFDCQERLWSYAYVVQADTDEFLIIEYDTDKNSWMRFFDIQFNESETAGVLYFNSKIHILDWGPSNNRSSLLIGQYLNCTVPISDRVKFVYKPDRIIPGSVITHRVYALPGYREPFVIDSHVAMHHYRTCRWEWRHGKTILHKGTDQHYLRKYESDDLLYDFKRHQSEAILEVSKAIEKSVNAHKAKFKI